MSQEAVEHFLGRLITDDRLRRQAVGSLATAAREAGYLLSDKELQAIKLDDLVRLGMVAARLDAGLKRFS